MALHGIAREGQDGCWRKSSCMEGPARDLPSALSALSRHCAESGLRGASRTSPTEDWPSRSSYTLDESASAMLNVPPLLFTETRENDASSIKSARTARWSENQEKHTNIDRAEHRRLHLPTLGAYSFAHGEHSVAKSRSLSLPQMRVDTFLNSTADIPRPTAASPTLSGSLRSMSELILASTSPTCTQEESLIYPFPTLPRLITCQSLSPAAFDARVTDTPLVANAGESLTLEFRNPGINSKRNSRLAHSYTQHANPSNHHSTRYHTVTYQFASQQQQQQQQLQQQKPSANSAVPDSDSISQAFTALSNALHPLTNDNEHTQNAFASCGRARTTPNGTGPTNYSSFTFSNATRMCQFCNTNKTPEWRRGPAGAKTLCNACGLRYAKYERMIGRVSSLRNGN